MNRVVLHHDCNLDHESYSLIGPFATDEAARDFIDHTGFDGPCDGGYAFAAIVWTTEKPSPPDDYLDDDDEVAA